MRKLAAMIAAVVLTANLGVAQPADGGRGGRMSPEERQKMMQERSEKRNADLREKLSLSEAQAHKLDSINAKYDKQLAELMKPDNRGGDRDAMRSRMENVQLARAAEVKSQLTPEQVKKYDEWLKAEQRERRDRPGRPGMGGGRGNGAPAPMR